MLGEDDIGTVRWFGRTWGAPVCDPRTHIAVPVGKPCAYCPHPIGPGAPGIAVPSGQPDMVFYHWYCWMRSIMGDLVDRLPLPVMDGGVLCPQCGSVSYNAKDAEEGCGYCHETAD